MFWGALAVAVLTFDTIRNVIFSEDHTYLLLRSHSMIFIE